MRLECVDLSVDHGALHALQDVSFYADSSECVAVVGPNGAGKSTLVNALAGIARVAAGKITWGDAEITGKPPHSLVSLGIGLVPEGRRLFGELTVDDNIRVAGRAGDKRGSVWREDELFELFPRLAERRKIRAARLSGGEQQMLAIARTLRLGPTTMILDEPSIGLAPLAVKTVVDALDTLIKSGVGVIIVEQNVAEVRRIANRAYVLSQGRIVKEGPSDQVLTPEVLHESYLGVGHEAGE